MLPLDTVHWKTAITQPCLIYYLNTFASRLQLTFPPTLAQCGWVGAVGAAPSSLLPITSGNLEIRSNPTFGIQFRSKWIKTIYVLQ